MSIISESELVPDLADLGVTAFTTTRAVGSFGMLSDEPVRDVSARWSGLRREIDEYAPRFATAGQVHGNRILTHAAGWSGWLRGEAADGHFVPVPGTAVAVTVADCVPIFIAHPRGAVMALHSGWRGTVARILDNGLSLLKHSGFAVEDVRIHLGPAICGRCYEVSPDVYTQLTGRNPGKATPVDLRVLLAEHARAAGARRITISDQCTRCNNDRFYSHRVGDLGRQVGVIVAHARH